METLMVYWPANRLRMENAPSLLVSAIRSGRTGEAATAVTSAPATGVPAESWTRPVIVARSAAALATIGHKRTPASSKAVAADSFRTVRIVYSVWGLNPEFIGR